MKFLIWVIALLFLLQCGLTTFAWWYGGVEFAMTHAVLPFVVSLVICSLPGIIIALVSR